MFPASRARVLVHALAAAGLVCAGAAILPAAPESSAADAGPAPGQAAMRATIDPETGLLSVSSAPGLVPDGELQEALRQDSEGLVRTVHPDGSVSVHLQGRFQSASVAHRDGSGNVVVCTDDASALAAPAPAVEQ